MAQLRTGDFETINEDGEQVSILVDDQKIAVEQARTRPEPGAGLREVTARVLGPGRAIDLPASRVLGADEIGPSIYVSYVLDPAASNAANGVASLSALLDVLPEDVSMGLLLKDGDTWVRAGVFKRGDALETIDLDPGTERDQFSPEAYFSSIEADQHLAVLANGEMASAEIAEAAMAAEASVFAISSGFADALPAGIRALGSLTSGTGAQDLIDMTKLLRVTVYDVSSVRRMPFEGDALIKIESGEISQLVMLKIKSYGLGHLLNPLNIPGWITTPGRRWFAAISMFTWLGFVIFAVRLLFSPRQEVSSQAIAEIELFYESRTVDVFKLPFTIGRAEDNDLVIKDDATSRRHAELRRNAEGDIVFEDLGSANGSLHQGAPVSGALPIEGDFEVSIPTARLIIRLLPEAD